MLNLAKILQATKSIIMKRFTQALLDNEFHL